MNVAGPEVGFVLTCQEPIRIGRHYARDRTRRVGLELTASNLVSQRAEPSGLGWKRETKTQAEALMRLNSSNSHCEAIAPERNMEKAVLPPDYKNVAAELIAAVRGLCRQCSFGLTGRSKPAGDCPDHCPAVAVFKRALEIEADLGASRTCPTPMSEFRKDHNPL